MEYFRNKINGKKGLKALIEKKYAGLPTVKNPEKPALSQSKVKDTLSSLKEMSQFHPNKKLGQSLIEKINNLLEKIRLRKKEKP